MPRRCLNHADCPLGELCEAGACLTDLEADRDRDGVPDGSNLQPIDNRLDVSNPDQIDADRDGSGDVCDSDDDNDLITDTADNCPLHSNPLQRDADADGAGNACDDDWVGLALTGQLVSPLPNIPWVGASRVSLIGARLAAATVEPGGAFRFSGLEPGLYGMDIVVNGHLPTSRLVQLDDADVDLGRIALSPESSDPARAVILLGRASLAGRGQHDNILVHAHLNGGLVASTAPHGRPPTVRPLYLPAATLDPRPRLLPGLPVERVHSEALQRPGKELRVGTGLARVVEGVGPPPDVDAVVPNVEVVGGHVERRCDALPAHQYALPGGLDAFDGGDVCHGGAALSAQGSMGMASLRIVHPRGGS